MESSWSRLTAGQKVGVLGTGVLVVVLLVVVLIGAFAGAGADRPADGPATAVSPIAPAEP